MLETYRACSVPLILQNKGRNQEKGRVRFHGDPEIIYCLNRQCWGHLRTKKMSSNAQALDMPHDWRFTKRTLWSHICHTFSSAAVSVTPSRAWPDQRNSSCSGKWAQDDSPASSVMITPPAIWCWTYYSTLGAYCIYDMMYDIGDAFSLLCNLKHLCLVTKSLYVNPLEVLKRTMKSNFSKQ